MAEEGIGAAREARWGTDRRGNDGGLREGVNAIAEVVVVVGGEG